MAETLLETFGRRISDLTLIPSTGGVFELEVDGELVYSKKATGRHAEPDELVELVRARLA